MSIEVAAAATSVFTFLAVSYGLRRLAVRPERNVTVLKKRIVSYALMTVVAIGLAYLFGIHLGEAEADSAILVAVAFLAGSGSVMGVWVHRWLREVRGEGG